MSNFQRRHYEAIAEIISAWKPDNLLDRDELMILLMSMFKSYNPNFNREKFKTAIHGYGY